jgi:signal transduction histidine kinase/ActR/RegA family two-component response regulator
MRAALVRLVLLGVCGVLIAALAGRLTPMRRLELWTGDAQARLLSEPVPFDEALIIAIDEGSLERLRPTAGSWPFDHHVFARVTDYLSAAGARSIVFNILFADERPGDEAFAASLAQARAPVTLAAVATPYTLDQIGDGRRAGAVGWPVAPSEVPARSWTDVRLPRRALTPSRPGVANLVPDEDGVVRRVPLFHRVGDVMLPSLPLAALLPDATRAVRARGGRIQVADREWPVDDDGQVALLLPSRPHPIAQVPFSRIASAALDGADDADLRRLVHDRTVFVGATALLLGDATATPFGRAAGLVVLAQAFVALDRGLAQQPVSWPLTALVLLVALAVPVAARLLRPDSIVTLGVATLAGVLLAWALSAALLAWWRQPTPLVLVGLAVSATFMLLLADRIQGLRVTRQRLTTERVAAERTAALKSEFLAHVSHELRTPLTAIIGFSGTLAEEPSLDPEKRALVQIVRRNGEQLLWLVNNLLDQARLAAGQMNIDPRPSSLTDLMEQALSTLAGVPRRPGVELHARTGRDLPPSVWIDAHRMRQIVINLGANALKFTERGRVDVGMDWRDGWLEVEVTDTGPGIAPEALQRIFEAFQQADTAAMRKGGTGLGLTISRDLARLMGGELTVESKVGAGSTFRARVPARRAEAPAEPREPAAASRQPDPAREPQPPTFHGVKALVADDSEDIRSFLQICLRQMELDVTLVADGAAALEAVRSDPPALVLIDVQMPELSGPDAIRAMRRGGFAGVIAAMTAGSGDALESELLACGCDAVVFKPVTIDRLLATVAALLERGPRERAAAGRGTGY